MNNYAIARVFSRIADLMEIQGENAFKIRAYRNAAQTMQEMTESLEVLAERGELQNIPGVGEAIAAKTRDIIATGTCDLYERLKEQVPESLIEVLHLPGFGPKKIQAVWRELGIRNLAELEDAAQSHRLQGIGGLGEKSEAKLLEAIIAHRRRLLRRPIGVALPYAEGLIRALQASGTAAQVSLAGSLRRRQDTVGNIDLAAAATQPAAVLDAFGTLGEATRVIERDEEHAVIETANGMHASLWVSSRERFPVLLQRRTGSRQHNEQLLEHAAGQGLSLESLELSQPAAEEEPDAAVYRALGLPWIAPELREGHGEIEAARTGKLPRLIEVDDIRGALHAHSTWSDGAAPIARMAEAAHAAGYAFHGNTDHSKNLAIARGLDEERLRLQMAEIDALNATFTDGFRVLKGIECDILPDGSLDLPLELLNELDVVVASVHVNQKQDLETMTQRILRALESGVVDILAHPTGRILGTRDPYAVDMDRVMDAALANRVALEINAFPDRLDLNEEYARQAKERGIPISINPDAHRPEHLQMIRWGISQARRAWLEPEDVINTWSLDRLLEWLHHR